VAVFVEGCVMWSKHLLSHVGRLSSRCTQSMLLFYELVGLEF